MRHIMAAQATSPVRVAVTAIIMAAGLMSAAHADLTYIGKRHQVEGAAPVDTWQRCYPVDHKWRRDEGELSVMLDWGDKTAQITEDRLFGLWTTGRRTSSARS